MNNDRLPYDDALCTLKERIAAADQQAFGQLFRLFSGRLNQFAFSLVHSRETAAEIVDEVFVKLWKNRLQVPSIFNLKVYLYTATKNTSLNYLSKKAAQVVTEPFDFFSVQLQDDQSPERKMITSELLKKIVAAVEALPPRCKMVFKLVREDGLKYKEVAEILNISTKTVDAQMVIAVKQISEKLKADLDFFPQKRFKKN